MFIYMIGYRHLQNLIFIFRRQRKALYLKKSRKKSEASQLMSKFYQSNKDLYPDSIKNYREEIITLLMEGFSPEVAFEQALVYTPQRDEAASKKAPFENKKGSIIMIDFSSVESTLINWVENGIRKEDESYAREVFNEQLDECISSQNIAEYWQGASDEQFKEIVNFLLSLPEVNDPDSIDGDRSSAGYAVLYEIEQAMDGKYHLEESDPEFWERVKSKL